jgi:hypothetical protein
MSFAQEPCCGPLKLDANPLSCVYMLCCMHGGGRGDTPMYQPHPSSGFITVMKFLGIV